MWVLLYSTIKARPPHALHPPHTCSHARTLTPAHHPTGHAPSPDGHGAPLRGAAGCRGALPHARRQRQPAASHQGACFGVGQCASPHTQLAGRSQLQGPWCSQSGTHYAYASSKTPCPSKTLGRLANRWRPSGASATCSTLGSTHATAAAEAAPGSSWTATPGSANGRGELLLQGGGGGGGCRWHACSGFMWLHGYAYPPPRYPLLQLCACVRRRVRLPGTGRIRPPGGLAGC